MWSRIGQFFKHWVRKRIFWLVLTLLAVMIFALISFLSAEKEEGAKVSESPKKKNPLLEDTDEDSLQAWEEQIYGTDPKKADTDGDGTPDGEEIKLGRNPLMGGPKDALMAPEEEKLKTEKTGEELNLTQELFSDFLRNGGIIPVLKKGGGPLASEMIAQKIDELAAGGKIKQASPLNFAPPPTKTSEDKSPESIKKYLNQVADIFEIYVAPLQKDDLDLFLEILQSGDLERLSELSEYRTAAIAASSKIKELTVPKILVWFHQRQIFYLEESARQLEALERAEVDPVTALMVTPQRLDLKVEAIKLYRGELKLWLQTQKVEITPKEKAYYLIN